MAQLKSSLMVVGMEKSILLVLQFLSNIVLARLLTPDDYGVVGMVAVFLALSSILVDSGLGGSLINAKEITKKDYDTVFWTNIVISLFIYVVLFFSSDYIAAFYGKSIVSPIIKAMGLIIIFNSMGLVQFSMLNRSLKFKELAVISIISTVAAYSISIVLAFYSFGVWALVTQQVLNSVIMTMLYIAFNRYLPSLNFSKKRLRVHWNWGKGLLGASIIKTIYDNIYLQIVGKCFSLHNAGLYNQANKLKEVPSQLFCKTFESALFPVMSKCDKSILDSKIQFITSLLSFIVVPIMFSICICSRFIVNILLGPKWLDCSLLMSYLSIGAIFTILSLSTKLV